MKGLPELFLIDGSGSVSVKGCGCGCGKWGVFKVHLDLDKRDLVKN